MFPPPEAMVGISGLAVHPSGRYFAVSERERTLFPITVEPSGRATALAPIPIDGVPEGLDIESVTFLDANTIAFGTESKDEARTFDAVLYGAFTDERVNVLDERTRAFFGYEAYGIRPDPNRGVEGLCAIDAKLVAAGEQVIEKDGARVAPLQVFDPLVRGWQAHELVLTSDDGKIAGLVCKPGAARAEVFAIERHYGTVRIIRFEVPLGANAEHGGFQHPDIGAGASGERLGGLRVREALVRGNRNRARSAQPGQGFGVGDGLFDPRR